MTRALPEDQIIRIYRETIRPLYAFVSRRVGGDSALAEDLVQETWMRALDTWPSRGMPDEVLPWLIRVARNTLVSHYRKSRPTLVDPVLLDLEHAAADTNASDSATVVSWGLARLSRRHADVIDAFYFEGRTVREIARDTGASERAVEGRLHRARARLKSKIESLAKPAHRMQDAGVKGTNDAHSTRTP